MTSTQSFVTDLLAMTAQMLTVAKSSDWDALLDFEKQRALMIETVKTGSLAGVAYMDEGSIRVVQIADGEIRRLVARRMLEIKDVFNASPIRRRFTRTYSDVENQI